MQELTALYETFGERCLHPNAFSFTAQTRNGAISSFDLINSCPFETQKLRIFALLRLDTNTNALYCWKELIDPNDDVPVYSSFVFLKISTQSKGSGGGSTEWWLPFFPVSPVNTPTPPTGAPYNAISSTLEQGKSRLTSLASWAKSELKSGITKAVDSIVSTEVVQLKGGEVVLEKKIAEGGFSQVYVVRKKDSKTKSNQYFAMKRCLAHEKADMQALLQEVKVHRAVSCVHVLELIDYGVLPSKVPGAKEVMLLLPLLNATGSMYDQMENTVQWPYPEHVAAKVMVGVITGVQSIHKAGFIHRDLKPHNVLFKCQGAAHQKVSFPDNVSDVIPVVMDLGSCTKYTTKVTSRKQANMIQDDASVKCSAPYRSPELTQVANDTVIDGASDVWSLGCVMYAITFGASYSPFEDPIQGVLTLAILQGNAKFPDDNRANGCTYSPTWTKLIQSMLNPNPTKRPSLTQIKSKLRQMST